jgi:hypothetical protein
VAEGDGNGGQERPVKLWADKAAAVVQMWSARRCRCSVRGTDEWGPRGFTIS